MAGGARSRSRVSPRLYLIVGALLIALPLLGYFVSNWYVTKKKWAEECFTKPVRRFARHEDAAILALALSPDGKRVLCAIGDGTLELWDTTSGTMIMRMEDGDKEVRSVAVTRDGRRGLSMARNKTIRIWDLESGKELRRLAVKVKPPTEFHEWVCPAAFGPDGRIALMESGDGTIVVLDLESGDEIRSFGDRPDRITQLAVSADGKRALSGVLGRTIYLWDISTGDELRRIIIPEEPYFPYFLRFSPDAGMAVCINGTVRVRAIGTRDLPVRLWDLQTGEELVKLPGYSAFSRSAAVSPDGKRLVTTGSEIGEEWLGLFGVMHLWEARSGKLIRRFDVPSKAAFWGTAVGQAHITSDGHHVLVLMEGWMSGSKQFAFSELLLWRLPDETGYWLLGTQDEP